MKEILDIGSGKWPAPGATRAIDARKPRGGINRPESLQEYRQARAEKIPYPDSFFKKVVSRWALGPCIFSRKAYREIARVLKLEGRVEVRLLWKDRRYRQRIIYRLGEVGIGIYAEYRGVYIGKDGKRLTEFVICGRRAVRSYD